MKFIHDLLEKSKGNSLFLTEKNEVNLEDLRKNTRKTASFLQFYNVRPGDRVLIMVDNSIELVQILLATSIVRAIAVIINPGTLKDNLNYIIEDCNPTLIISNGNCENNKAIVHISLEEYKYYLKSEYYLNDINLRKYEYSNYDKVLLIYTSGSTGKPKAVVSTHNQVMFCVQAISRELEINDLDTIGCLLPFSFDYGLYQVFLALYNGANLYIGSSNDAGIRLLSFLNKRKITIFPSVPHLTKGLIKLLEVKKETLNLKKITNTGEHLPHTLIQKIKTLMPHCKVYSMYGLTECKRVSILSPSDWEIKPHSVGRPLGGTRCYIVNENNEIVPLGEKGELVVVGPNVMNGYWNQVGLTNQKFRKNWISLKGDETALFTGDIFHMDYDGYLYFHGRKDEQFKQKGFRLSIKEIEDTVNNIDSVETAILIPPTKEIEKSILFVRTQKDLTYINGILKEKLEFYKIPQLVLKIDNFPTTNNGKIDRKELINTYLRGENNVIS